MARRKYVPKTKLQKDIAKEILRIEKLQSKLRERGYHFKKTYKYNPKNASQRTLQRLKNIKTKQLQEAPTTTYTGAASKGKRVSGKEGAHLERSEAAKKREREKKQKREEGTPPDVSVIEDIRRIIEENIPDFTAYRYKGVWYPLQDLIPEKVLFHRILDYAEQTLTEDTARYYASVKGELEQYAKKTSVSDGNEVEHSLAQFAAILKGAPLSIEEKKELGEITEALERE